MISFSRLFQAKNGQIPGKDFATRAMRPQRCVGNGQNVYELKEKDKATFCSNSEVWSLPASSSMKPEEREFVMDSGASMHMQRWKDLNLANLEIVRMSRNPTMV